MEFVQKHPEMYGFIEQEGTNVLVAYVCSVTPQDKILQKFTLLEH